MLKQICTAIAILMSVASSCIAQEHFWRPQSSDDSWAEGGQFSRLPFEGDRVEVIDRNRFSFKVSYDTTILFWYVRKGDTIQIHLKRRRPSLYIADSAGYAKIYIVSPEYLNGPLTAGPKYDWSDSPCREITTDNKVYFYKGYTEMPGRARKPRHVTRHREYKGIKVLVDWAVFLVVDTILIKFVCGQWPYFF